MDTFNGLIKVSKEDLRAMCENAIQKIKKKREHILKEWIEQVKEHEARPRFFGLRPGKRITDEEALEIVKSDEFAWYDCKFAYEKGMQIARELLSCVEDHRGHEVLVTAKAFRTLLSWRGDGN